VLRAVAELAWEDRLATGVLDIPQQIIPGPEAKMRCCIYKERAIVGERIKLAMGGDQAYPGMTEVLEIACDECPVSQIEVGPACRGCIATRCVHTCPKDAITIVNHKATIDHSKCIMCGKCVSACPYSAIEKRQRPCERGCPVDAISMGENAKASIDVNKCISCGVCAYQCPFGAVMDKSYITDVVQMLRGAARWDFRVYAVVAPSIAGQFAPATLGQVVTGLKMLGFHDVSEVALGADLTAKAESEELLEKGKLLSSCCPAFVDYVEKNFPDLAPLISHTPSPMVMIGKLLKAKDPRARVVFVGPCIAKKKEFQMGKTMGAIDLALTFEELNALFESKGIEPEKLEETPLDEASGYGRSFAHSGGVAAAVAEGLKERGVTDKQFKLNAVACSGIAACKLELLKMSKGIGDVNFIEGMACEGGCVQGAGILIRSPRNQADVEKHAKEAKDRTILGAVEAGEQAEARI
jgi:[FeFe] hydrogenase (group B1/B3)